ncbi:MAG: Glycogen synthase [Parcubacteria group bacterium ADurb.Bin326]|nr:MAG: Glycogen synthase [Parcubacteria group bacterium ADurb.Bin326]
MKILQINKFLYPKGGAETYLFSLSKLLTDAGHEVIYFSQKNSKNIPCDQEKYFISDLELGGFSFSSLFRLGRIFWSFKAAKNLKKLIADEKPDLVHLHNIYHQLSPSLIAVAKSAGLPVVMTVHDFKLVSYDYTLRADGRHGQHKGSLIADLILRLEFAFHKAIKIYDRIDLFIAPSQFVKNKLVEHGYAEDKIIVIPHFIEMNNFSVQSASGDYILSFGRLDETKGFEDLIRAVASLKEGAPKIKIAGSGPEEAKLNVLIQEFGLTEKAELLGKKDKPELARLIAEAKFVCFPTRVHETFGLAALESLAYGKPVVASRAGALTELIRDEENGILFDAGNIDQLASAITKLNDPKLLAKLSQGALNSATNQKYSSGQHLKSILEAYLSIKK